MSVRLSRKKRKKIMLSARNQFAGKVTSVKEGAVNGTVTLDVNGAAVTATISMDSIKNLGIKAGEEATAFVKATEVMVGLGELKISARNQFAGKIAEIEAGAVNSIIVIEAAVGTISATISNAAVAELGLEAGKEATAVIKATSVMIGC